MQRSLLLRHPGELDIIQHPETVDMKIAGVISDNIYIYDDIEIHDEIHDMPPRSTKKGPQISRFINQPWYLVGGDPGMDC